MNKRKRRTLGGLLSCLRPSFSGESTHTSAQKGPKNQITYLALFNLIFFSLFFTLKGFSALLLLFCCCQIPYHLPHLIKLFFHSSFTGDPQGLEIGLTQLILGKYINFYNFNTIRSVLRRHYTLTVLLTLFWWKIMKRNGKKDVGANFPHQLAPIGINTGR